MATVSMQQRTPQWHAARRGKLTASNVGAALGLCPWTSRQQAYNRAMGLERFQGNDATRWGTDNEANGVLAYSAHTGNVVDATGLHVHPTTSWLAGSPDGLIGEAGLLEVKCPYWRKKDGTRVHQTVPAHYYMQMLGHLCNRREGVRGWGWHGVPPWGSSRRSARSEAPVARRYSAYTEAMFPAAKPVNVE